MKKLLLVVALAVFTVSIFSCSPTSINEENQIQTIGKKDVQIPGDRG